MTRKVAIFSGLLACSVAIVAILHLCGYGRDIPQPNIVLVVLDTVRRDYTDAVGGPDKVELTPVLHSLARDGAFFTRAFSTAPWTAPSHASMFTGLLPSEHGCTIKSPLLSFVYPTTAALLSKNGYNTVAAYANPWLDDNMSGVLRGFDSRIKVSLSNPGVMESAAGNQGGRTEISGIARWLDERPKDCPFFLFVNFLEAHLPYDPTPEYRRQHLGDMPADERVTTHWAHEFNAGLYAPGSVDWSRKRRLYAGDVNRTDELLGRLFNLLHARGLYEDAVIIVTSDHGENLGEHGLAEHQYSVHETLLSVPLVIRAPYLDRLGMRVPQGRKNEPVMLSDLFATVLRIGGVFSKKMVGNSVSLVRYKNEPEPREGGNLVALPAVAPGERHRPLVATYAGAPELLVDMLRHINPALDSTRLVLDRRTLRWGDWRLSVSSDGCSELHNMLTDPGQTNNLVSAYPDGAAQLKALLDASSATAVSAAILKNIEELKSLGYVR